MQKLNLTLLALLMVQVFSMRGQIVTTEPAMLQESSENVVIFFHADQGNKGLMGLPPSAAVYAHTGVITSRSTSPSDWQHAPLWLDNAAKYKLSYVSANLWKLDIGDIRGYYGITDPAEKVRQLAFVFRNADGSRQGKTSGGGDIFVDVADGGLQVSLSCSIEGNLIQAGDNNISFTASSTRPATLTIDIDGTPIATRAGATTLTAQHLFDTYGTFTVTATAVADGLTVTDRLSLTYPRASRQVDYPGGVPRMGAVRQADGSVIFCIAAPLKNSGLIVGAWDDYRVLDPRTMNYQDYNGNRYFWIKVEGLTATDAYPYYYIIDGKSVADPYARLVLDPNNDKYIPADVFPGLIPYPSGKVKSDNLPLAVYQENINAYDWKINGFKGVDKDKLVIYELLVRDFTGTEGKALGDGTIAGAMARIPYLKALGVNAIELLPINEFNGNISWGYNPNFYFAPDKAYGTPSAYKAFIDACHSEGIAVILDMVFNQTDWLHPWYQLYEPGQNPFYNADAPHAYSVLNDWNQGHPLVQQQFEDCLRYWMTEYKVDGFRFDLVKGLGDNDSYANAGASATDAYNVSRVRRMARLHAAMRQVNPDAYFINENLAGAQEENEMAADGELNWANLNKQGGQYAMGFSDDSGLKRFYAPDDNRIWGSTVSYLESHDEQRLACRQNLYGATGVRGNLVNSMHRLGSAAAQMLLSPGAHMIWQFSELGNYDSTKDANGGNNTDPKTVRWNLYDNASRRGLYDNYSELCAIRRLNPELMTEGVNVINSLAPADWSKGRFIYLTAGNKELICVINPEITGDKTFAVRFSSGDNDDYQILSKSHDTSPVFNAAMGQVTVPANCYVVIANRNVVSVNAAGNDDMHVTVYGGKGRIVVEGDCSAVQVYDINGRRMDGLVVPSGIYIVRVKGMTSKVLVR